MTLPLTLGLGMGLFIGGIVCNACIQGQLNQRAVRSALGAGKGVLERRGGVGGAHASGRANALVYVLGVQNQAANLLMVKCNELTAEFPALHFSCNVGLISKWARGGWCSVRAGLCARDAGGAAAWVDAGCACERSGTQPSCVAPPSLALQGTPNP